MIYFIEKKTFWTRVRFEPSTFWLFATDTLFQVIEIFFTFLDSDPGVKVRPKMEEAITIPIHYDPVDREDPKD